jgi:hypothetical protein
MPLQREPGVAVIDPRMLQSVRLVCWIGVGMLLAPGLFARMPGVSDATCAVPLSVQACDTRCQSTETDCDLACDQVAACVEECKKVSETCTEMCHDAPPPAPRPADSAKPSTPAGKKAPVKGAPVKGAPVKGAPVKAPPKAKPKAA